MSPFTSARILVFVLPALFAAAAPAGGCASTNDAAPSLTREELLDPTTCARCHEDHYREWSGSMHAYAAEDPVFLAMNKRFQRENQGQNADFCVKCHAPMAVLDGKTKDGLNLAEVPQKYRGVTCFFCHTVESVGERHNNGLVLSERPIMRGSFSDAVPNSGHRSMASALHNSDDLGSSKMCGSCHDVVTPAGAHIERTFSEWEASVFGHAPGGQTCGQCHMKPPDNDVQGKQPIANVPGVFARTKHSHVFAGVDRALTPWPGMVEQKEAIQKSLDELKASLCVSRREPSAQLRVILDNAGAGHSFPSGATADRRVWVELVATKAGQVVYQSGVVKPDEPVLEGPADPDLWLMRDRIFADGKETHSFWQATCYDSNLLPFGVTADSRDPRFYQRNIARQYPAGFDRLIPLPDTVTMQVYIIPVALEVLDDLIASGDLDPATRGRMERMAVGPKLTWTTEAARSSAQKEPDGTVFECVTSTNQDFSANKFPMESSSTCPPR